MLKTSLPAFFQRRRNALNQRDPAAAYLLPSHPETIRNHDVHHSYRQDSSFYYLSGFEEAESWLLLLPQGNYYLFVREKNPEREIWDGERYGVDGAKKIFSATETFPISKLEEQVPKLLDGAGVNKIYFPLGRYPADDQRLLTLLKAYRASKGRSGMGLLPVYDPVETIGEMRLIKGPEEIESLKKAAHISALGHCQVMRSARAGMNESDIEALIDYEFRRGGCQRKGYDSIVASGKNACVLHYVSNNEVLKDGDLLLIDAGGEFDSYSADITRTFPISGKFSKEQALIYDWVLKAQKEAIKEVRVGKPVTAYHERATEVLTEGLLSLGLLKFKDAKSAIKENAHRRFYPHGTGHWLGMDVHDSGLYRVPPYLNDQPRKLEEGMVLTVEPGLYCQPNDNECPAAFRGIGVRIEDDILVTAQGPQNLTHEVPKERDEVEALCRR